MLTKARFLRLTAFALFVELLFVVATALFSTSTFTPVPNPTSPTHMIMLPEAPVPDSTQAKPVGDSSQASINSPAEQSDQAIVEGRSDGLVPAYTIPPLIPTNPLLTLPAVAQPFVIPSQPLPALPHANPVPNQIVIQFKPNTNPEQIAAYVASFGGTVNQQINTLNTVVVSLPQAAAQSLPASAIVLASEPDYFVIAQISVPPSDAFYDQQWALPVIGVLDAWLSLPADAPRVAVAVIDSGVCADHPDLQGRILPGWDFVENDAVPQDEMGHGCGVAGIIAANVNDGVGMAGVAPNAMVMPLRVLDAQGIGTYSNVVAALVYAADNGAQVINLSLGGANSSSVLEEAVNYAVGKGLTVVASAGNTGGNLLYPAAYEPVIAVGSVDQNLQRSSFSAYLPQLDLLAPGRDILTTKRDGTYGLMSGTSFAAPYVAGVAALEKAWGRSLALTSGVVSLKQAPTPLPPTLFPTPSVTPVQTANTDNLYYYYRDQKLPLTISGKWIAVRFRSSDAAIQAQSVAQSSAVLVAFSEAVQLPNPSLTLIPIKDGAQPESILASVNALKLSQPNAIEWVNPLFELPDNGFDGQLVLTDEFIAQFPPDLTDEQIAAFNTQHGVEIKEELLSHDRIYVLRVTKASERDALAMANYYQESGFVLAAEPNFVSLNPSPEPLAGQAVAPQVVDTATPTVTPTLPPLIANDTYFSEQWALNNTGQFSGAVPDADIDAPEAWNIETGRAVIAIIDDAVDIQHADLNDKIVRGFNAVEPTGSRANDPSPNSDAEGRGTLWAGIAAAESNNNQGVAGVCWGCRIMGIKVRYYFSSGGGLISLTTWLINGINYAYTRGADVISIGFLSYPSTVVSNAIDSAIRFGRGGRGAVVIAPAGDDNTLASDARQVIFPASHPPVIAVAATNLCDQRASQFRDACNYFGFGSGGSNYGPYVDIAAPGIKNYTTTYGAIDKNGYHSNISGTSAAASIVTGVVGLILSQNPNLSPLEVEQILETTADDVNDPTLNAFNIRRVNAFRALERRGATSTPVVIVSPTPTATPTATATQTPTVTPMPTGIGRIDLHPGGYDDRNSNISYDGSWSQFMGAGPGGSTLMFTNVQNATAQFAFNGGGLILHRTLASNRGPMEVCIDTSCQTINNTSPTLQWNVPILLSIGSVATHTVRIRNLSTSYIDLDSVRVLPALTPLTPGLYQETDPNILFLENWTSYSGPGPNGGALRYSNDPNAQVVFAFTGSTLKLYLTLASNRGPFEVCIDAICQTISNYAEGVVWSAPIIFSNLGGGTHTLFLHNTSSSYIDLDAVQVMNGLDALTVGLHDDMDENISYSGSWGSYSGAGGNTLHYTQALQAGVSFNFMGDGLVLYRTLASNRGDMEVCIDGACQTISNYNAGVIVNSPVSFTNLGNTTHTLTLRNLSTNFMDLNAVRALPPLVPLVAGFYQQTDPNINYLGAWFTYNSTLVNGGSLAYANDPNAQVSFQIYGDALTLYRTRASNRGPFQLCIDTACQIVNNTLAELQWNVPITIDNLSSGIHNIVLSNLSSNYIDLDAIRVGGTPAAFEPGLYDDRDSRLTYSGLWYTYNGSGPFNATFSYNNSPGDAIRFRITGDAFRLYRTKAYNRGPMEVCIDTILPCATVSNYDPGVLWNVPVQFGSLGVGTHTVIIRNASASSSQYLDLDAIEVFATTPSTFVLPSETPTIIPTLVEVTPTLPPTEVQPTATLPVTETPTETATPTLEASPEPSPSPVPTEVQPTPAPTSTPLPTEVPTETSTGG